MFGEMLDTSPTERARYYALLRAQTPQQRGRALAALTSSVRQLAELAIKREFPEATPDEVRVRLTVRLYGLDAARRLHSSVPEDAR